MKRVSMMAVLALSGFVLQADPATGWKQTAGGTYDYNDEANWVNGEINGIFGSDLTLEGAQTITFAADTTLAGGLTFAYAGNYAMTLQSDGTGTKTLTLNGDVTADVSKNGSSAHVTIGSETAENNLIVELGGVQRTFAQNATQNDPSKTGWMKLYAVLQNGAVSYAGLGPIKVYGANTYTAGTTLSSTGYFYMNNNSAFGSGAVTIAAQSSSQNYTRLHCDSEAVIANNWVLQGDFSFHGAKTSFTGSMIIDNPVTFWCESANLTINSPEIVDSNNNCAIQNFKKFGGKTLTMNTPLDVGGKTLTLGDGVWRMYGKISGQGGFTVVGQSGKGSYMEFYNAENDFSGLVTISHSSVTVGLRFAVAGSLPQGATVKCEGRGVIASCLDAGYSLKNLLEGGYVDKGSTGVLCFGTAESGDIDLTDYPNVSIGATGNYTFSGTLSSSGRIRVASPGYMTISAENAFMSAGEVVFASGQVYVDGVNEIDCPVSVESGTLYLRKATGSFPNAKISVLQGATIRFESDVASDVLRAKEVALQAGTLYFQGHKNNMVTHSITKLTLSTMPGIGGTPQISWSSKDSKQTTLHIGTIERPDFCFLNLSGGRPGEENSAGSWNIFVDQGVENTENGIVGTTTAPFVPWMRNGLTRLVYNDPTTGLRFHTDAERELYSETYSAEGPRTSGENMLINFKGTVSFSGETAEVATFCFGSTENQNLEMPNDGVLRVTSGVVGATWGKVYPKVNIDLCGKHGYILGTSNKDPRLQGSIGGTDKGLTIANEASGRGNQLSVSAAGTYSGDVYIHGAINNSSSTFFPSGVDRPGNIFLEGLWQCGNCNVTINGLYGSGQIRMENNFNPIITLGADGSDGDYDGVVVRTKQTLTLVKIGAGRQRIGGECSHSSTTVSDGTLQVDGAFTASPVSVAAGATLAGCGSFAKAVTLVAGAKLEAGSEKIGADDVELNFDGGLVLGGDTDVTVKVVGDNAVGCISASSIASEGTVTIALDGTPKNGEYLIVKSDSAIPFSYRRGSRCGTLTLRNDGRELWMRSLVGYSVILR